VSSRAPMGADKPKQTGLRKAGGQVEVVERVSGLFRWAGFALFLLGSTDVALTWLPTSFGNREWEFATVTSSFNGMPVILLGLVLVVATAAWEGRRWWALAGGIVAAGFFLFVLAAIALWATNLPLALESVEGVVLTGLKKAVLKTSVQSVILPIFFGGIAYQGFRGFRSGNL